MCVFSVDYVVIYYFILFVIYLCIYVQPLIKVYVAHQMVVVLLQKINLYTTSSIGVGVEHCNCHAPLVVVFVEIGVPPVHTYMYVGATRPMLSWNGTSLLNDNAVMVMKTIIR